MDLHFQRFVTPFSAVKLPTNHSPGLMAPPVKLSTRPGWASIAQPRVNSGFKRGFALIDAGQLTSPSSPRAKLVRLKPLPLWSALLSHLRAYNLNHQNLTQLRNTLGFFQYHLDPRARLRIARRNLGVACLSA